MPEIDLYEGIPRPSRVRAARDLRAWTQGETVDRMRDPISSAALSQIESGKVSPSRRTLNQLADALQVPVEFFFAEWDAPGSEDVLAHVTYFRDLAATPAKERRRAGAMALLLSVLLSAIESRVQLPKVRVPQYLATSDSPREEIEDIAQAVRGEWDMDEDPIPHVVGAIEQHGVPVARLHFGAAKNRVDGFSVRLASRPIILLTDDKSNYVRSRFDAAHELGHLVMHRVADPGDRAIERQAQDFAASLLLPASTAIDVLPKRLDTAAWARLAELKREWGISIAALLYRARDLDLIDADAYRNGMKYMSARGWRTTEPGDRQMGLPEAPRLLDRSMHLVESEYGETAEQLVESAHLPIEDTIQLVRAASDRRPHLIV